MPGFPLFRFNYPYSYSHFSNSYNKNTAKNNDFEKEKAKNKISNEPILEIMGIKLFQDDILILSLLFFLYKEGVKDEMLFFSLIFLLIS